MPAVVTAGVVGGPALGTALPVTLVAFGTANVPVSAAAASKRVVVVNALWPLLAVINVPVLFVERYGFACEKTVNCTLMLFKTVAFVTAAGAVVAARAEARLAARVARTARCNTFILVIIYSVDKFRVFF